MPVPRGTTLDPAATRARILDAATDLFQARGVHAVGVNDVAAAANASKVTLYRHFASKQALVAAVLVERSARIHSWLRDSTRSATVGPEAVLSIFELLAKWYLAADFTGCAVMNTTIDVRGDDATDVRAVARQHLRRYRELLVERLQLLDPAPDDAARLARQLLLLIEGATAVSVIDGKRSHAGTDARRAAAALIGADGS